MSNARPMSSRARRHAYQPHGGGLTPRQARQHRKMRERERLRALGDLPESGASGVPVRKPRRGQP